MKKNILIYGGALIFVFALAICLIMRKSKLEEVEETNNMMGTYSNYGQTEPDDDFSENVMEAVGDCFIYKGKESFDKYGTVYEFFIWKDSFESVAVISKAINENDSLISYKAEIRIEDGGAGYYYTVIKLFNYYGDDLDESNYDGFYSMRIECNDISSIWADPSVYTPFEGIKHLEIPNALQEKADEEGIDWYEIWPDLEGVEIF